MHLFTALFLPPFLPAAKPIARQGEESVVVFPPVVGRTIFKPLKYTFLGVHIQKNFLLKMGAFGKSFFFKKGASSPFLCSIQIKNSDWSSAAGQ